MEKPRDDKKIIQVNINDIAIYDVWFDSEGNHNCNCDKCKKIKGDEK